MTAQAPWGSVSGKYGISPSWKALARVCLTWHPNQRLARNDDFSYPIVIVKNQIGWQLFGIDLSRDSSVTFRMQRWVSGAQVRPQVFGGKCVGCCDVVGRSGGHDTTAVGSTARA